MQNLIPASLSFRLFFNQDQLSFLIKHQHTSNGLTDTVPGSGQSSSGSFSESYESSEEINMSGEHNILMDGIMKVIFQMTLFLFMLTAVWICQLIYLWQKKCCKDTLRGALRREQLAETEVRRLRQEIEHLKCLVFHMS